MVVSRSSSFKSTIIKRDSVQKQSDGAVEYGQARYFRNLQQPPRPFRFGVVPASATSIFGKPVGQGCRDAALRLSLQVNHTCEFLGPKSNNSVSAILEAQISILTEIIANGTIDGLAVSVTNPDKIGPLLDQAVESGIAVVTFDSDAPMSKRQAYVGTNNTFFGIQLAKVLKQLQPDGGTFGVINAPLGDNLQEREDGFLYELMDNSDVVWTQIDGSPSVSTSIEMALDHVENFTIQSPTAIALMLNAPMAAVTKWERIVDRYRDENIFYVSADSTDRQLDLLTRRYVHGLVGQLPYEMGFVAVQVLYDILNGQAPVLDFVGTNVVTHIQVPLVLPELHVDENRVGYLAIVGYVLFGIIASTALAFGLWCIICRQTRVVKASQPMFLLMVAIGILIMASAIIPLSFDDTNGSGNSHDIAICMSIPWLICTGFIIAFSALLAKTRRVNCMFKAGAAVTRVSVSARDVLLPGIIVLILNFTVLICWTVIDPLTYTRVNDEGTDGWNRVISTYGTCQSEHIVRYWIPLAIINVACLGVANWQAYEARNIQSEFSESKYIGFAMLSLLQTALMGIPILLVVQDEPEALYLVLVFMIFIVSMAVLLLIFVPKMVLQVDYRRHSQGSQRRMMAEGIRQSVVGVAHSSRSDHVTRGSVIAIPEAEVSNGHRTSTSTRGSVNAIPEDEVLDGGRTSSARGSVDAIPQDEVLDSG